jgi:hypothetical protein
VESSRVGALGAVDEASAAEREARALPEPEPAGDMDIETLWARLVESVGRASPFTRSYLLEAHPVSHVKGVFTIGFDPEFADHIALVDNSRNHTLLQTKLAELGHANGQFKFIKAEAPANRPAPVAENVSREVREAAEPTKPAQLSRPSRDASAPKEKATPVPFNKDDFKNDPLIQKALEIFKGTIVEVRA